MGTRVCQEEQVDKELDPEVQRRRNELFQKYVSPFYNMIYKLTIQYSFNPYDIEENYNEVLINLFRGIETYDPKRSIRTWIHICTKRHIKALERKRTIHDNKNFDKDIEFYGDAEELLLHDDKVTYQSLCEENYRELYGEDVLSVLDEMKDIHRDALVLQEAGYSLDEIVEIEYQKGSLKTKNTNTIKSRLFFARQYLKSHLTRNGKRITDQTDDTSLHADS